MPAQGMTVPLMLDGKKIGHVMIAQDVDGGLAISGGSFGRPDLNVEQFLNIYCVTLTLKPLTGTIDEEHNRVAMAPNELSEKSEEFVRFMRKEV